MQPRDPQRKAQLPARVALPVLEEEAGEAHRDTVPWASVQDEMMLVVKEGAMAAQGVRPEAP